VRVAPPAWLILIALSPAVLSCWLGTVLSREGRAARSYQELHVRAETGIGAH
jgi:hypothetical protein